MPDETELLVQVLEGATTAPILFFDEVPVFGISPGYGRITLSAHVQNDDGKGTVTDHRVVVAHLRGNAAAFTALRNAINQMEVLSAPVPEGKPN